RGVRHRPGRQADRSTRTARPVRQAQAGRLEGHRPLRRRPRRPAPGRDRRRLLRGGALKLLLDSHVLVWWMNDDARLGAARRRAIARAEVYFSPLSAWELGLKILAGRLDLGGRSPISDWI